MGRSLDRGRALAVVVLLAVWAVAGACAAGDSTPSASIGRASATTTSVEPAEPATTDAPPTPSTSTTLAPLANGPAAVVVSQSGVVLPVVSSKADSWVVRTPCNATATLRRGNPVQSPTIVLDPGHGGAERGAVSPGGLAEATVNLAVARQAQAALEAQGVSTLLTRTGDYEMELPVRTEIARDLNPRAFVSVHHNAEPDGPRAGPGSETYYQIGSADSKRLAGLIYEEVVKALSQYDVAWVADTDAGAKYRPSLTTPGADYYAVLRQPGKVVSVLAELAFVSNPPEAALLARPDVQKVEGEALARGIVRWLTTSDPGSGFTVPYPRVDAPPPPGPTQPSPPCQDPPL